jgi:hypothetical protein
MAAAADQAEDLRGLIRELLADELARIRAERGSPAKADDGGVIETVRIDSDAALQAFVRRLLTLAGKEDGRAALASGRLRFRLNQAAGRPAAAGSATLSGVVTERQVETLPAGTTVVALAGRARLTPLARDRLRRRGITIERSG